MTSAAAAGVGERIFSKLHKGTMKHVPLDDHDIHLPMFRGRYAPQKIAREGQ
jgi:hypothetical protein